VILVLLFWLLGAQDSSWPELPAQLQEIPSVREAYENRVQGDDPELAAGAAAEVIQGLPQAELSAQADFVLALLPRKDFHADLAPTLRRIRAEWSPLTARIEEVLVAGMGGPSADLIPGSLAAARILSLSDPQLVEATGKYLRNPQYTELARAALQEITRREFVDFNGFSKWWTIAKDQTREQWLASVNDQDRDEILRLWSERLAENPKYAFEGLASSRTAVRLLAADAFAEFPAEFIDANMEEIRTALGDALEEQNRTPRFHAKLVALIPRFYDDGEATEKLNTFMLNPREAQVVRLAAAEGISRVSPKTDAFRAYVGMVRRLYLFSEAIPSDPELRSAVLSGLWTLARSDPEFIAKLADPSVSGVSNASVGDPEAQDQPLNHFELDLQSVPLHQVLANLRASLSFGLSRESNSATLAELFAVVAEYGTLELVPHLVGVAENPNLPGDQRYAAIDAAGALAKRTGYSQELLNHFGGMLAHSDYGIRYAVAGAFGVLEDPDATLALAQRLSSETDPLMFPRLLKQIGRAHSAEALPILLQYEPPSELRSAYRQAVVKQIRGEGQFQRAVDAGAAMLARGDAELARRFLTFAPAEVPEGTSLELSSQRTELRARAEALWVLSLPDVKAEQDDVVKALAWLAEQEQAQPQAAEWPRLAGELRSRLGQGELAFAAWARALTKTAAGSDYDTLAIKALLAGEQAGLTAETTQLLGELKEFVTPEAQAELLVLRERLLPKPAEESEVTGEDGEAGQLQASPSPAPAEAPDTAPVEAGGKKQPDEPVEGGGEPVPEQSTGGDGSQGGGVEKASLAMRS